MLSSPFDLPEGIFILITDEIQSPADFLLHRSLIAHLKNSGSSVILSVSECIARWKAIAAKSNMNLTQHISSGSLDFVDVLTHTTLPHSGSESSNDQLQVNPTLLPLFHHIASKIGSETTPESDSSPVSKLIILDDITSLEWIGFSLLDITRFTRALRVLCLRVNATLIIRHHNITPNEPDDLFRHLLQLCRYHLDVRPLSSGRSGTVSGEVALHPGLGTPVSSSGRVKLIPRSCALQYRLTDSGVVFFGRGTSGGVL